jgi:hypothetical protein
VAGLAKAIFRADLPEQYARTFPAQSLYLAIKYNGLESSLDLIEIASLEQCRLFLDFDLWEQDHFVEENFWVWLSLADEENGLALLQRLLRCMDLKLVALIIERYVEVCMFDEKTDNPPGPRYYSPDRGATWIHITTEDSRKHFLLARFLALIFETSPELFYQLVAIPGVQTASMLEEEAFNERSKRLASEGIPEKERAHAMHAALNEMEARQLLSQQKIHEMVSDIRAVEPLVYSSSEIEPLRTLLSEILPKEDFQSEFTLIVNAALVYFNVNVYQEQEVFALVSRVKGALNIGLEVARTLSTLSLAEIYKVLGTEKIYRLGFTKLQNLSRAARKVTPQTVKTSPRETELQLTLEMASRLFPEIPTALRLDGTFETTQGSLATTGRAFQTPADIDTVLKVLNLNPQEPS